MAKKREKGRKDEKESWEIIRQGKQITRIQIKSRKTGRVGLRYYKKEKGKERKEEKLRNNYTRKQYRRKWRQAGYTSIPEKMKLRVSERNEVKVREWRGVWE